MARMNKPSEGDDLPADEIARHTERGIRRFLNTPSQPRGKPIGSAPGRKDRGPKLRGQPADPRRVDVFADFMQLYGDGATGNCWPSTLEGSYTRR